MVTLYFYVTIIVSLYLPFAASNEDDPQCENHEPTVEKCCDISAIPPVAMKFLFPAKEESVKYTKCAEAAGASGDTIPECLAECGFRKRGLIKANSKLHDDLINMMAKGVFGRDNKWKDVAQTGIKECLNKAPKLVERTAVCKTGALQFINCIQREVLLNCPADLWNASEKCKEEKAHLQKCPKAHAVFHEK